MLQIWVQEKLPLATSHDVGNNLQAVQTLQKKTNTLNAEVDGHVPQVEEVIERGKAMIEQGHPQSEYIKVSITELEEHVIMLKSAITGRKDKLVDSNKAQQVKTLSMLRTSHCIVMRMMMRIIFM